MDIYPESTVKEVASILGAEFEGKAGQPVTGINEIHKVRRGDITFVDHPKYYQRALNSPATTIIINKRVRVPDGKALIFSTEPFNDYVKLVKRYYEFEPSYKNISDTAVIGQGTIVQPGAFIGNHVRIGKNCLVHANVSINDHTVIGDNVIIHPNTVIGADAFYYKKQGGRYDRLESCGRVRIENNVEIGANCTIDRGVSADTIIGEGTKLDNLIQIGHDTIIGKNCLLAAQVGISGAVTLEDNVTLWGQVGVNKDLVIGKGAVVLGQSGIAKSIEGNKIYFGSPACDAKEKKKEIALLKNLLTTIESLKSPQ
ncbi:MAG: UDP-3-O-(3-hydroxymyristoyl)glucosamine N-acyltransferase [Bacteroidales bacterium]